MRTIEAHCVLPNQGGRRESHTPQEPLLLCYFSEEFLYFSFIFQNPWLISPFSLRLGKSNSARPELTATQLGGRPVRLAVREGLPRLRVRRDLKNLIARTTTRNHHRYNAISGLDGVRRSARAGSGP